VTATALTTAAVAHNQAFQNWPPTAAESANIGSIRTIFEVNCSSRFDCHFPAQSPRLFSGHLRWLSSASAGTLIQVHHQLSQFVLVARDVVRADAQVSAPCLHSIAVVKGSVELGNSRNHTIAHAPCFACHQNVTQLSV
jgi:hypothetical protein